MTQDDQQDKRQENQATEEHVRLAEALVFASAEPITRPVLRQLLPENADPDIVMAALARRYAGRGVELAETGTGWQFRTAADLAPRLKRVVQVPRRLPRLTKLTDLPRREDLLVEPVSMQSASSCPISDPSS